MDNLKIDDIHLKFLLNLTVPVSGIGEFRAPLLRDIVDITEQQYRIALNTMLFERDYLGKEMEEIAEYTDTQLLAAVIYQDSLYRESFHCACQIHFNKTPSLSDDGEIYFDTLSKENILTDEKFNYIKHLVRIANNIQEKQTEEDEEIIPGNEQARKFMEELKKSQELLNKAKKKEPINLHSLISSVGWKTKSFDFINQLNIYQLYDGYYRLGTIDNYHYTMTGIYSGTIDADKVKLPDINWANIIKK